MQIKKILKFEFNRFIFIGISNTIIGYLIFAIFNFLIENQLIALIIAYAFGIVINFKTYSHYVFTNANKQIFINFIAIYLFIFLFNYFLLYVVAEMIGLNIYFVQLIAIAIVTPVLYILNKQYVFIEEREFGK